METDLENSRHRGCGGEKEDSGRQRLKLAALSLFLGAVMSLAGGCQWETPQNREGKTACFIGIDAGGAFRSRPEYQDSLRFLAHYIHARVNGLGGLKKPEALYVGALGGQTRDGSRLFRTRADFEGKPPDQVEADLSVWLEGANPGAGCGLFFESVVQLARRENLISDSISILLVGTGVPQHATVETASPEDGKKLSETGMASLARLDGLARNVTVRLLYASPRASEQWVRHTAGRRLKLRVVPGDVMSAWNRRIAPGKTAREQAGFFQWIQQNVDCRVSARKF